ncbi:MAG: PIN domain-containing protein [Candidatus Woesearchaeota archaeon]|nr:PIN domain-containing protein [Candidatus Woesearchaeota archaeon]
MKTGSKYLIDTHAWIECMQGTKRGKKVRDILINKKNTIIVADATFAELYCWATREGKMPGPLLTQVRKYATVFELYTNIWVEAAHYRQRMRTKKKRFGLIDASLLAIQELTGATIVTGDAHFDGLKNVLMI